MTNGLAGQRVFLIVPLDPDSKLSGIKISEFCILFKKIKH
jgi:hypothetical protein